MKKFFLPAAIILLGGSAAFVTQSFKNSDDSTAFGHRIDRTDPNNPVCVDTGIECSTIPSVYKCQDGAMNNLWELVGTSCPNELFKP
ncbi:hypothetical protein [Kaistella sp.]|uniref:hypothetical protein n=1 Tax=Kaistella sp. TaxID=2782235 RepID=UPI003C46E6A9